MFARGIGSLIGLLALKYLPDYFNSKALILISTAVCGLCFYVNYLSLNDWNLIITYILVCFSGTFVKGVTYGVLFALFP